MSIQIFQYLDIPKCRLIKSLSDFSKKVRIKSYHNIRLACKNWYYYENKSRCRVCYGRYIVKKNKYTCGVCCHNFKIPKNYIWNDKLIWKTRLSHIHHILKIMYFHTSKRDNEYIWSSIGPLHWVHEKNPIFRIKY